MTQFLSRIRTYRLMVYYMAALLAMGMVLAGLGIIRYRLSDMAFSASVILATCLVINWIFARSFRANSNPESVLITGLILVLIITPFAPGDFTRLGAAMFASSWAVASKFMLATGKRQVFNPAALGVALAAIVLHQSASWWVGDSYLLLPLVAAGGILILQRLAYADLLLGFGAVVLGLAVSGSDWSKAASSISLMLFHSSFFFFAFVMLTEPRTAPLGRWRRMAFGALTGLLYSPLAHLGSFYFTPEVALLAGNVFTLLSKRKSIDRWLTGWRPRAHLAQTEPASHPTP